ncbi:MAG: hypothetical protein RLZZ116_725 [Planctomycetota bacterium]
MGREGIRRFLPRRLRIAAPRMTPRKGRYNSCMKVAPIARLAVPTGTAAAVVVMREPTGDPSLDARRFSALESLDDARFRATFEELIVSGVYTVLSERVLVLRVSDHGVKSFAAVVALSGGGQGDVGRAGLFVHGSGLTAAGGEALQALLEAETKQRPVFHGMTAEGVTYSGFEAKEASAILAAANAALPSTAVATSVALLFAGAAIEVPRGLFVAVGPAPF